MEPILGMIQPFGFTFAPRGWAFCDGQILPINQYQSLYSLLGTMYGGDGRTTFALPDLRGRSMLQFGSGPGLSPFSIGNKGGAETVTLNTNHMPNHQHMVTATTNDATLDEAASGARFGTAGTPIYAATGTETVALATDSTTAVGGSQSFDIRNPYIVVSIGIALVGTFPSRN